MREIKFRFWYKEENRMVYPNDKNWELFWSWSNNFSFAPTHTGMGDWNIENKIVTQFTGLKDKNGKEIYEGDIINEEHCKPQVVIFEDGKFCLRIDNRKEMTFDINYPIKITESEIIGNIYESKHLLDNTDTKV